MRKAGMRVLLGVICASVTCLALASSASGAASDPLFVYVPTPPPPPAIGNPPPAGQLQGPCGLVVDSFGRLYVSDYYHHAIDVFAAGSTTYLGQLANQDPLDGPCGLALDSTNRLYVNHFHRGVVRYGAFSAFGTGIPIAGVGVDGTHPTGVAVDPSTDRVYVNQRTYVQVYEPSGAPMEESGEPVRIGEGTLGNGYGVAVSRFPSTLGHLYVPDASSNTVKVYDPAISETNVVAQIHGPGAGFRSLRDSAVAVDRVSGNVYVVDDLQPSFTEKPEAAVYVFGPTGAYLGALKYKIYDARPPGLAVDNSATATQGRVYVTSGNTVRAGIYAYGPGAQTGSFFPPTVGLAKASSGDKGMVSADSRSTCLSTCEMETPEPKGPSISRQGTLRLNTWSSLSPERLPRSGSAPIAVSVGWSIDTADGSTPPDLRNIGIEINRHVRFDYAGLPTCPTTRIQHVSAGGVPADCRSSLVGKGIFTAAVPPRGYREAYEAKGRLLVFNGELHGKPALLGHFQAARPLATPFVIPFAVKSLDQGPYGTLLEAIPPKDPAAWGELTGIRMKLSRRYRTDGTRHSYVTAGCPVAKRFSTAVLPLALASVLFEDGTKLGSTASGSCQAKG